MFGLTTQELAIFRRLSTPIKIQDFLDALPINFEKKEETYYSPRRVLRERVAHCMEGALFAAVALWLHGEEPLILDLKADGDDDHVVALYRRAGFWGAISKTNHATLRFRDPVYRSPRELAISYFHEYFVNDTGKKVLRSYSRPMNLARFGEGWVTAEENLFWLVEALDNTAHYELAPKENLRFLRPADEMERKAGRLIEWRPGPRRA
ncbi:MAG: hypothetical protein ACREGH_02780 [Minisyncoccia bacterium]